MEGHFVIFSLFAVIFLQQVSSSNACRIKDLSPYPCEDCQCEKGENACEKCSAPCVSYREIPCEHGQCIADQCSCDPCWAGDGCDMQENNFPPQFTKDIYEFFLKPPEETTLQSITAFDNDETRCSAEDECPCAVVNYVIKSGNDAALFVINGTTGDLTYHPENGFTSEANLTIAAFNPFDPLLESSTEVVINFQEQGRMSPLADDTVHATNRRLLQDQETMVPGFGRDAADSNSAAPKSRHKRAVTLPTDVQYTFKRSDVSKTTCCLGDGIHYSLEIFMPKVKYKIKCELFTPRDANNDAIFVLTPPTTTIGKNFMIREASVPWRLKAYNGGDRYDHAKIDLGIVQNYHNDTTLGTSSKITFDFSAVVTKQVVKDQLYHVSAGCLYHDKKKVWVGQAMCKGVVDNKEPKSTTPPAFKIEGPTEVAKNSPVVCIISMTLYDMYNDVGLLVEPNPAPAAMIKLVRVSVASVGANYASVLLDKASLNEHPTNSTIMLRLGKIFNTGFRRGDTNATQNTIKISVYGYLMDSDDVVIGTKYSINAAVQVDDKRIWVAEKKLTAKEASTTSCTTKPSFTCSLSHDEVVPGTVIATTVNITTPPSSVGNYTYLACMPYNSTSKMALVDKIFKLSYIGSNHAGFEADSSAAVLTSEANNDINDCVEWPLGTIRNSGEKSGKAHNTVQIRILAKLLSTDDDILWVTVGVKYCDSWLWVAQIRFNVVQELPSYVEPKLINFVVRSPMRRADIYENGTYVYWLDVHIPPGTQYKPLKIDIAGPYYDKALLEVCVAKIMHVGDKIKGFNASNFNPDFVSTGGNDINDRVIFTLGQLSNVGTEDADEFWMLNIVRVQVVVSMTVHNTSINYTKTSASPYCVAFGCRYDAKKLWVGSTCLERGDITPDIEKGEPEPKVEQVELKSSPKVKYGEAFGYEIVLLVPYGTSAVYTVSSLTSSAILSVCRIRIKKQGSNIPCLPEVSRLPRYMSFVNQTTVDMVQLNLGAVSNIGYDIKTKNDTKMNTVTIITAAYLKPELKDDPNGAADTKHWLGNAIKISDKRIWIMSAPKSPDMAAPATDWTATFVTGTRNVGDKVVLGGCVVMFVKIDIPAGKSSEFQVDVYTEENQKDKISICDFRLISTGYNLPCVNGTGTKLTKESENDNKTFHKASLDLGWVSNMVETSDTESDDNQMVLEAVLCVKRDLETVSGDKINVAAAAKYADKGTIVVGTPVEIEVTDTLLYDEKDRHQTARLYPLDHTPTVNFNNRTVWSINITLTEMTAVYNITIETVPSGTKALVAIDRVRAHYFGIGNCGIDDVGFKTIQNSSVAKTTQITNVSLTTWPVTNTLTSARDQWSTPRKSDSTLTISFESVICEDSSALKNSLVKFLVNVSRLGKEVATFERHFKRDITKKTPKLSLNISVLNNATEAVRSGQTLSVEVAVNHTAASSAWAKTVIITVLIPPFLQYMSVITSKPKAVNGTVVTEGIQFKIPLVYFVDTYKWTFNLTVDPDKFFERGTPNKTVTLIADAVYKGRTATSYATEMAFAKFTLETEECNDMLGLEDKTIKDCQIFASTSISNSARFVRLNTESGSQGWQFLNRGPTFEGLEFIQIKIGNQALITGISIQSAANDYSSYPTTFRVKYSEESMFWQDVINSTSGKPKLFTVILGETQDAAETAYIDLGEDSFKARYVRLMPVSNSKSSDKFVMRMELHGCLTTDDVNATEVCKADTAITYPSDYYERGYIVDTSTCHLYVCAIPAAGQLPVCSFTTDKGKSWSPIDDSVINIHCLENATKRLVGLSKNLKSRVMSKNGGETWNAHPDADCSKLNQQDLIRSKPLSYENSFTDKPGDSPENWNCPSLDVKWGVTKNGLYVSESGSWSQTCVASFGVPCN